MSQPNKIDAGEQCATVQAQLVQALMRQDQLQRELDQCKANVLALTNISAGIQLGAQAEADRAKAQAARTQAE